MKHFKPILLLLLTGCPYLLSAQIIFDLSDTKTKTEAVDIKEASVVKFINMLPNESYSVTIDLKEEPTPAFETGALAGASCLADATTTELNAAFQALANATKESEIPDILKKIEAESKKVAKIDKVKYAGCIEKAAQDVEATTFLKDLGFSLRFNQTITITVTRGNEKWIKIFKTLERSPWVVMYGFTFVPNKMNPVKNYYCEAVPDTTNFTIVRMNNERKDYFANISPTVLFQWRPFKKYSFHDSKGRWLTLLSNNFYQIGFSGGLSLNFAKETSGVSIMLGPSIVFADNLSLSIGPCLTPKSVLRGKYQAGDVIATDLDFDQLHEKKYLAEWFITFAVRFDQNPFKQEEKDE